MTIDISPASIFYKLLCWLGNLIHDIHHLRTCFGIDGIKVMSRGISEAKKKVITLANKTDRGRIFLFFKNETPILVLKNVQFEHG